LINSAFWGQSFVAELTRISAHGERKLKLRRESLAKQSERQAAQMQEHVQSPISNVDSVASPTPLSPSTEADRSMLGDAGSNGNGVGGSNASNGNGADEIRGRANGASATGSVANGEGEANGAA
jgi:hypothetical protein